LRTDTLALCGFFGLFEGVHFSTTCGKSAQSCTGKGLMAKVLFFSVVTDLYLARAGGAASLLFHVFPVYQVGGFHPAGLGRLFV
jgi:hypothetical protein